MAVKHQAPRGTRDLLPDELERWQWAEARAREVLARYAYREIRTPIFEEYELFARTSGESSDVVQKEMYRFKDLKGRDLALRPEGTAGVCRAFVEHGLAGQGRVHRLWYMGPMFRYGRPQKGRFRQFWQVGAEILGTLSPAADVEMIALFLDLFEAWGFRGLTVAVNSVGTPSTRAAYATSLKHWLEPVRSRLSEDSRRRLDENPLRVLDTKDPNDLALIAAGRDKMPRLIDALDAETREHWDGVLAGLQALGIPYEIDDGLVRGLDYYTRTAFEVHDRSLGAQSALGGGGRYDGLVEDLGGPATPGVGFSIGLDRVILALGERASEETRKQEWLYIVWRESTRDQAFALARQLRRRQRVLIDLEPRSLGAQMKAAGKSGARWALVLGEKELEERVVILKDLWAGERQVPVPLDGLPESLAGYMAEGALQG
ncbi:MAG TPA: histidine--tRNA ligase [Candidatus Eisenbacteria bacterium]